MNARDLVESSGYSFEGSWTPDLVYSKIWLLRELAEIRPQIPVMYILGSWFGNLAAMIHHYGLPQVTKIINVDSRAKFIKIGSRMLDAMGADNVQSMIRDANQLNYRQLAPQGVIVNTSLTDMPGREWFDRIPRGTLTVLQGRDHDPNQEFADPDAILQKFPMSKVRYQGTLALQDPETQYRRSMVIGEK